MLAAGGLVLLLATTGQLANARNGFAATLVILVGVVLVTAPIWRRLLDSRAEERTARIRSEERAAVAAHLHDSVLQTLALIQRHADDQQAVNRLARSQERELRAWLYDPTVVREGGTWAGLVAGMVAEVEADHALIVDPVVVGDAPVDEALAALGAANREALVNAAKHSGATAADLYTEVTPERVSVFVRDRGKGFDPETVPDDRRGLRDSVRGRLTRLGGTAEVRSAPGRGPRWSWCCRGSRRERAAPRVFVVDDHAMVRAGVRAELGDDVTFVGRPPTSRPRSSGIRATLPDVVLLDVHLPGGGGRAVLETLRAELPEVRWLALSVSDAAEDVIAVIRAGAKGYVTKTISGPDLLDAVRRVADGDVVFSPRLAGFVLDAFAAGAAAAVPGRRRPIPGWTCSAPGSGR